MVRIRNLLIITALFFNLNYAAAQRIRKDHKEMTPSEVNAYVAALRGIQSDVSTLVTTHQGSISQVHNNSQTLFFLPWHRVFMLDFETKLRNSTGSPLASNLSLPYWDWRTDFNTTTMKWDDSNFFRIFWK